MQHCATNDQFIQSPLSSNESKYLTIRVEWKVLVTHVFWLLKLSGVMMGYIILDEHIPYLVLKFNIFVRRDVDFIEPMLCKEPSITYSLPIEQP